MSRVFFNKIEDAKNASKAVFIGYDPREDLAAKMCADSIRRRMSYDDLVIVPIIRDYLLAYNICTRPLDPRGSTQFSITRFMVPHLMNYNGVGIFFDGDMLITRDIKEMFDLFDPKYAVQVPQHDYIPKTTDKMDGLKQTVYPRKQWSASVIYNCDHSSNGKLSNYVVNRATPRYLHRFQWLKDEEIGNLPLEFNFLVEEQDVPDELPFNIHHTLGSPLFRNKQDVDFSDYWKNEFKKTFSREFTVSDIID
tara:strand:+ start:11390 stop:12142 length:753 start_codon:yes stop_codon:yes gene_type:complete